MSELVYSHLCAALYGWLLAEKRRRGDLRVYDDVAITSCCTTSTTSYKQPLQLSLSIYTFNSQILPVLLVAVAQHGMEVFFLTAAAAAAVRNNCCLWKKVNIAQVSNCWWLDRWMGWLAGWLALLFRLYCTCLLYDDGGRSVQLQKKPNPTHTHAAHFSQQTLFLHLVFLFVGFFAMAWPFYLEKKYAFSSSNAIQNLAKIQVVVGIALNLAKRSSIVSSYHLSRLCYIFSCQPPFYSMSSSTSIIIIVCINKTLKFSKILFLLLLLCSINVCGYAIF